LPSHSFPPACVVAPSLALWWLFFAVIKLRVSLSIPDELRLRSAVKNTTKNIRFLTSVIYIGFARLMIEPVLGHRVFPVCVLFARRPWRFDV